ncbi:MAG: sulfurtransferase TusA family protein [Lysobacterales bacterium]
MTETSIPIIDVRGLSCPEPVLRLRQSVRAVPAGTRLRLLASDPMASIDIRAYCLRGGHRLLAETGGEEYTCFEIETFRPATAASPVSVR